MSTVTRKKKQKKSVRKPVKEEEVFPEERSALLSLIAAATAGAILGLCAPGFNQWYLAWFALVPLLLLIASSKSIGAAFIRGSVFALAYNLVYLNWYLGLYPLNWLGFSAWQGILLAGTAWIAASLHQALITGIFAALCRAIPLVGGFLPIKTEEKWAMPSYLIVPLLWVLIHNKIGNASDFLGVPWSMIEYSQYQQLPLIQVASWIGGIGLSFLIVLFNVALAGLLANITVKLDWKKLAAPTLASSAVQFLIVCLLLCSSYALGESVLSQAKATTPVSTAVLQGNINIDMQKSQKRYTLEDLEKYYFPMVSACRNSICIWTENGLPTYLRKEAGLQEKLSTVCKSNKLDMIVGAIDYDSTKHPYNSAYGITSGGKLLGSVYHKRYLVPFGEYTPLLVKYMPEWLQRLTNTPAGGGFAAGHEPTLLTLHNENIAPLICFETISPELAASSVRAGGTLLVNISDLAWFHNSMIGQQMLAFATFRAVENNRYLVFAANSGPSAIISPHGNITKYSGIETQQLLKGFVGFEHSLTPFSIWFH